MRELRLSFDRTTDPFQNLVREEELFRRADAGDLPELVRFWVNSECLVAGGSRSRKYGWYDEGLARKLGVPVVTRDTGGGVVYHDRGNLNWSFFLRNSGPPLSPTMMFQGPSNYMVKALATLGVDALFAPPNRIDVGGYKVSGMAARSTPRAYMVHGTLLLHTDLSKLNRLCIPPDGCPPVANLSEWVKGIEPSDVIEALVEALRNHGISVRKVRRLKTERRSRQRRLRSH
jgi:lipoate-protein ligase A